MRGRIKKLEDDLHIAYGFDNSTGYFFQVMQKQDSKEVEFLVDECSMMSRMSNGRMVELLQTYNLDADHIMQTAISQVALDLPF